MPENSNIKPCGKGAESLVVKTNEQINSGPVQGSVQRSGSILEAETKSCAHPGAPRLPRQGRSHRPAGGLSEPAADLSEPRPSRPLASASMAKQTCLSSVHRGRANKQVLYFTHLPPAPRLPRKPSSWGWNSLQDRAPTGVGTSCLPALWP